MNIQKALREALSKDKDKTNNKLRYGCVMVSLEIDQDKWKELQDSIEEDDIYFGDEENTGFGREMDPHVTILFGLHADVPDEDVEDLINKMKKPKLTIKKISSFTNDKFDVLKFDVESKDLVEDNKNFKTLPHTSTYPNYHPHMTIAYLKKGMAEKYVEKLKNNKPIENTVTNVLYSKADGSKKEYDI